MNSKSRFLPLLLLVLFAAGFPSLASLLKSCPQGVSENAVEAVRAVEELRSLGPTGLQVLLTHYANEINRISQSVGGVWTRSGNESRLRSTRWRNRKTATSPPYCTRISTKQRRLPLPARNPFCRCAC